MIALRPNQVRAFEQTTAAIAAGERRICVTSPTGSGKTRMMIQMIEWAESKGLNVALYTQRKMLHEQTAKVLENEGIGFGLRASGHKPALLRRVQLCMTQTELSAVYKQKRRELHPAQLVLIDEAHQQTGETMAKIMADHIANGAACVGYTATPLDIGDIYTKLIVAGKPSEMFQINALVPAHTFAPDEPDMKGIQHEEGKDLTEKENHKAMMRPGLFGRVLDHYRLLNPEQKPALLFAPGVKESVYFAEEFTKAGIPAAHIDGANIWINGESHVSDSDMRAKVMEMSRTGEIKVVCNRFVLREGIDAKWLVHGIFATVFGSLTSYLQSGGRLLRAFEGKDRAVIQDHGGNWWRHGSLNEDREWSLGRTSYFVASKRIDDLREKRITEPIVCPNCGKVRTGGRDCPFCGYASVARGRKVVQSNGKLTFIEGDIVKPRDVKRKPDTQEIWDRTYYRMRKCGRTFRQAEALFFHENYYWPPKDLKLMPKNPKDWWMPVDKVPTASLN